MAEQTRDGQELTDFALSVLRDQAGDLKDRLRVMEFLAERMLGRPHSEVAVERTDAQQAESPYDYSKLSMDELETLESIMLKALRDPQRFTELS